MGNISSDTTKKIKVKGYTFRKNGKKCTVKGHTRKIPAVTVTKKQYAAKFQNRPPSSQAGDKKRRSKNTLKGTKNKLRPGWNTENTDWVGVDARAYPKITKTQKIRTLTGSIPAGYKIIKFRMPSRKKGQNLTRYLPYCKGSPIGPTTPHAKLKDAQNICNRHHGRATGQIKNRSQENVFFQEMHRPISQRGSREHVGAAWTDPRQNNYMVDWKAEDDHSLSYSERLQERKKKKRSGFGALNW